ncbi:MAG: stage 0 sporulation family protein [Faecalibacterium sp.]
MTKLISVRFRKNGKSALFSPAGYDVALGDYVVVATAHGTECGEVTKAVHLVPDSTAPKDLKSVVRMADGVDVRRMHQNHADEERAFTLCTEQIAKHKLDMKLIEAEYTLDRSKIVFYFTSDGRVDFRDLVKDLAGVFRTRIELRQIGVRDESKMLGGLGICGQPFCCSRFLQEFQPVSIKMAKEQGLSLNPTKISGSCGRLMCCLSYEQDAYEYLNSIYPMVGSTVRTPDGVGTVLETNPVSGYLKVRGHFDSIAPKYYKAAVCEYISGGKRAPKKPDIQDDYSGMNQNPAPIVASSEQGGCPKNRNAQNAKSSDTAPAQKQNNAQNQSQNGGQNGGRSKPSNYRGNRRK